MFEGMDFSKMGQILDQMQAKAKQIEEENARKEFTVKSGAGMVAIRLNGAGEVLDLSIDDSLFSDKESLQILLISAIGDAIKLVENEKKDAAASMLGGLGGLGDLLGDKG